MKVAVPWLKHSWMFGQLASSQTVTRRFSRSFALRVCTALPDGIRTRIHDGLRSTGASANCTGERLILSPPSCLTPACSGADALSPERTCKGMERALGWVMASSAGRRSGRVREREVGQGIERLQGQPELARQLGQQHRFDGLHAGGTAQV